MYAKIWGGVFKKCSIQYLNMDRIINKCPLTCCGISKPWHACELPAQSGEPPSPVHSCSVVLMVTVGWSLSTNVRFYMAILVAKKK